MAWRLNKGDWSEAYVFLKLLAEGRIYSGDEDLNKVLSVYMDVLKIIRKNLGVKMSMQLILIILLHLKVVRTVF